MSGPAASPSPPASPAALPAGEEAASASLALPALLRASSSLGLGRIGLLSRAALQAETASLPEGLRRRFGLLEARGALLAAFPYGAGPPEPPTWAAEPLPLARLGAFVRYNWYAELGRRLRAAGAAARAALEAGGLPGGAARNWRHLVNSGLPERPLALASGLGYLGKSGLLLAGKLGPGVLLGLLLLPFDPGLATGPALEEARRASGGALAEGPPPPEALVPGGLCGPCRACAEACPSGAILPEGGFLRERCLQHWTARPGELPPEIEAAWGELLYGCDRCVEACPRYRPGAEARSGLGPLGPGLSAAALLSLSEAELGERLRGSALGQAWISRAALRRSAALVLRGWKGGASPEGI